MMSRRLATELIGIVPIYLAGSALHFAFDWLGRRPAVGVFAAVNESVWEHCKLAFWPTMIWAAVVYVMQRHAPPANVVIARAAGLALMPLVIIGLFYAYTALLGRHVLWVDLLLFGLAIAAGQTASALIMMRPAMGRGWEIAGAGGIVVLAALFAVFTFAPPRLPLFRDGPTGTYGVR